jgi:5-oxoprolinase (ATP-hydrolysing)
MAGGEEGACGRNLLSRENGIVVNIGGGCSGPMDVGERLRIETPVGGGYGPLAGLGKYTIC